MAKDSNSRHSAPGQSTGMPKGKTPLYDNNRPSPPQGGSPAGDKPAGMTGNNVKPAKTGGNAAGSTNSFGGGGRVATRPVAKIMPTASRNMDPNRDGQLPASPAKPPIPSADTLPPQLPTRENANTTRTRNGK
jgi:hypothetical protein